MNIAEAKMCWCPFARVPTETFKGSEANGEITTNRDFHGDPDKGACCIAELCMAWRWLDRVNREGYCGLAGKPTD